MKYNTGLLEKYLKTFNMELVKEFYYVPNRKFRADFAIRHWRILIEVVGGVYNKKAHGSITGVLKDIERLNLSTIYGYQMFRVTPDEFRETQCVNLLECWRKQRTGLKGMF